MGPYGYVAVIFFDHAYLVVPSEWERVQFKDEESAMGLSPYPAIPVHSIFHEDGSSFADFSS